MIPIYKSDNEIEANVLLSLLRANDITCKLGKFRQGIKGSAYKEYSIWVEEESEEEAKRLIASREDNSPFANMPWDRILTIQIRNPKDHGILIQRSVTG